MITSPFKLNPYYHQSVRKLIIGFGQIFTDITIVRNSTTGKEQVIRCPIDYGPKNKWLNRLNEDPDLANNVEVVLPRIAFEITNYAYDPTRKVGAKGEFLLARMTDGSTAKIFNPVPYDITIQLHTMCKNQDDSLQILEQILPYFAPSMTLNLELLPEFGIKKDIPIEIQGVSVVDNYEGSVEDFRVVIQTITFVAEMDLFGPIITSKSIIKTSIADVGTGPAAPPHTNLNYTAAVDPNSANKNDPHVVDEAWINKVF